MTNIDPLAGSLAVTFIHSVLYGGYLFLLVVSLYIVLFRRGRISSLDSPRPINRALVTSTVILLCLVTAHWVLEIITSFELFIRHEFTVLAFLDNKRIATTGIILAEVVVADLTMMYRLFIVWGRNLWVVLPSIITTAVTIGSGTKSIVDMLGIEDATEYYTTTRPEVLTLCSSELATNMIVTGLIVYRIWSIDRVTRLYGPSLTVMPLLSIIVESASIFTILLIIILVTYLVDDAKLSGWALQLSSPAIGIAFCLIIVRCGLGLGIEERDPQQQSERYTSSRTHISTGISKPYLMSPNTSTVFSRDSQMLQVDYFTSLPPRISRLSPTRTSLPNLNETEEYPDTSIGRAV